MATTAHAIHCDHPARTLALDESDPVLGVSQFVPLAFRGGERVHRPIPLLQVEGLQLGGVVAGAGWAHSRAPVLVLLEPAGELREVREDGIERQLVAQAPFREGGQVANSASQLLTLVLEALPRPLQFCDPRSARLEIR